MDDLSIEYISKNKTKLLADLDRRQAILRDNVRSVALNYSTGLYLHGRPGTAKTHTVRATLDTIQEAYVYRRGHITPGGLFELLEEYPDSTIVLDDLVSIFKSDTALQLLLAALEGPTRSDRTRLITYQRQGERKTIAFRGGIVCITNRELSDCDLLGAFKSRVHVLNYNPSDAHIGAHLLDSAEKGWPMDAASPTIPPEETKIIAEHVITEMARLGLRFDLRIYYNKAIVDYIQWSDEETESDWRDLVTASIEEHLIDAKHTTETKSREERKGGEIEIVREIMKQHSERNAQVEAWKKTTGKSSRAFYRRMAEVE
ncbi:MAG: hypothetical protein K8U57_00090 [Planctomycetes bacterium]|nr:hypothetical protein [Planctomycetota bacterium]